MIMIILNFSIGFVALSAFPSLSLSLVPPTSIRTRKGRVDTGRFRLNRLNEQVDDGDIVYDVAIIGSGPASCSLASLLTASPTGKDDNDTTEQPPNVVVLSKYADKRWVPNYGCWTEEWSILDQLYAKRGVHGLMELGVDVEWQDTDCFFGEFSQDVLKNPNPSSEGNKEGSYRRTVGKEYLRVSREGLKNIFCGDNRNYHVIKEDVLGTATNVNVYLPGGSITFHDTYTELTLKESNRKIKAKIVVDGTGAESPFTIRDNRDREGYQIAYGAECRVEGAGVTDTMVGDYDRSKMTLFDFRSEKWRNDSALTSSEREVMRQPTFNYVMPISKDVIFFEETSLVANPAMSFKECKDRLAARLKSQNVYITDILEEEYCYIPMGGGLPRKGQRIVPIGAASGLVHPSTGYQVGRCLSSNLDVSEQILAELKRPSTESKMPFDPDAAAARIIGTIWTPEAIRQRNFAIYGGDFFMTLDVNILRQFFAGFFRLEPSMWGGFLAGWKNLPGYDDHKNWSSRLRFGLTALSKLPPNIAIIMAFSIFSTIFKGGQEAVDLIQSVTPLAGEPDRYDQSLNFRQNQGDLAAKDEAMELLCGCDRCEEASNTNQQKEKVST